MRDILFWAGTVEVLGLVALPILRPFFGNRRDAALLSRPVGLALVAYAGWAGTLLPRIPFERRLLLITLAAVAALSWTVNRKTRRQAGDGPFWGAEESRAALWFWASTGVFLVIRAAVPEILGAEKFMDLAFLNSITRHGAMPPLDPWMSGKTINYYYWGYLLAAVLAKLSSVTPFVSYNLSVATFAGYSFCAAASLGARLTAGSRLAALASGVVAVFSGNVQGALDAIRAPFDKGFDYWHASRVIADGDTINEFPFFTFFHADLHPHLLAFPYFLATFVFAHRLLEGEDPAAAPADRAARLRRSAFAYLLCALIAGTAVASNKWNTPAVGIALAAAAVFRKARGRGLPDPRRFLVGAVLGALTFLAALLLWLPNSLTYQLPNNGLGWTSQASGLFEFLRVWGLFFAVGIASLWPTRPADEAAGRRQALYLAASAGAGLLGSLFFSKPALLPILFLALLALRRGEAARRAPDAEETPATLYAAFLLVLALGMIGGCEFIYFKDSYGDKLQRMNTIFKFYHQAWPLFGIAVIVFAESAWRRSGSRALLIRAVAAAALGVSLLYPIEAAVSRLRQHEGAITLDALPSLARRSPADAAAVIWLEKNAGARSVILEATGDPYREFARISSHTGLPTVLGWANHEGLWRSNDPEVGVRAQLVKGFYSTADEETALEIVRKFGVQYVVLGDLERAAHPNAGHIADFLFLEPVLTGQTTVYKVRSAP